MPNFPKAEADVVALAQVMASGLTNNATTAVITEATLTGQPRGPQLEYRIKAVNIGGESIPSNTVAVVL